MGTLNTSISCTPTNSQHQLLSSESDLDTSERLGGVKEGQRNDYSATNKAIGTEQSFKANSTQNYELAGEMQHGLSQSATCLDIGTRSQTMSCSQNHSIYDISHTQLDVSMLRRGLKRTRSSVRLSMSLDGKAQVILDNGSSPSPPRPDHVALVPRLEHPDGFRRCQTDVVPEKQSPLTFEDTLLPWPKRMVPGRSRDARTWEFYCDSDTRNALTVQAEREQKGSAEGAIGLIRSSSNKVMRPNSLDQHLAKTGSKRKAHNDNNGSKPKFTRTASSIGRLETTDHSISSQTKKVKSKRVRPEAQPALYRDPSGDSDKENWEPGTQISDVRTQRQQGFYSTTQRAVLKESSRIPSQSTSLGAFLESELGASTQLPKSENIGVAGNTGKLVDEVFRAFMQGNHTNREEEDLDCVQNLLSLSQGIWK